MSGFVYFFLRPKAGTVKVGFSVDPSRRMAQIQTGCDENLQCVAVFKGDRSLERKIHRLLEPDRVSGEWFLMTERLRDFLMSRLRSEANSKLMHADALEAWGKDRRRAA